VALGRLAAGVAFVALAVVPASAAAQIRGQLLQIEGQGDGSEFDLDITWTLERTGSATRVGTGFSLAVRGEGDGGLAVWGSVGSPFAVTSPPRPATGTGTRVDPFVLRRTMRAGARLELVEELRHVDGEPRVLAAYDVRNVSAAPVSFRAAAFASFAGMGRQLTSRAVAEVSGRRRIGSEIPEDGVPLAPGAGEYPDPARHGHGGLLEELSSSPWSRAELGSREEVLARLTDDASLRNTYASGFMDAAAAAQWDAHASGHPPLQPGAVAHFEVAFVLTSELWAGPGLATRHPSCGFALRLTTAYARGGPRAGRPILVRVAGSDSYEPDRTYHVTTDAAGEATVTLSARHPYLEMDGWGGFFDRDADGQLDDTETARGGWLTWDQFAPPCTTAAAPPASGRAPAGSRARPHLRILRAVRRGRRLAVRARLDPEARGRVRVVWIAGRAASSRRRATAVRPRAGRIRVTLSLPRAARWLRHQHVTLRYAGSPRFLAARVTRTVRRR
jgi:hypothetical protein